MISANALRLTVSLNVLTTLMFLPACKHHDERPDAAPVNAEQPDPKRPYFVLSEEKARVLRSRINALELGETSSKAIALVGPPDKDYYVSPMKPPSDWKFHYLTFYFTTVSESPGNIYDGDVDLVFNRQDKLTAIYSNVDGIGERGARVPVPRPHP